jgi:hypothetical protein
MIRSILGLTLILGFSVSHADELPAKHLVACFRSQDACHNTSVAYMSGLRQGMYGVYDGQKEIPHNAQIAECVVTRTNGDIIDRIARDRSPSERQDLAIFMAIYSLCADVFTNAARH